MQGGFVHSTKLMYLTIVLVFVIVGGTNICSGFFFVVLVFVIVGGT